MVTSTPLRTGGPDGYDEPSSPAHDRRHDDPQPLAGDAAILHLCGQKIQPPFWKIAGPARHRGYPCVSTPSDRPEALVVAHKSNGLRAAVLLWRHVGPAGGVRTD